MTKRLRKEWAALRATARGLDRQTSFVLVTAVILVLVQFTFGSRSVFYDHFAVAVHPDWQRLAAWAWWFSMKGVLGFVIPVLCLTLLFKRRPAEIGLGAGDWRLALALGAAYLPFVLLGTWVLSAEPEFQQQYPHLSEAAFNWQFFVIYELLFLFYWVGWEYLWRGYVLFGTAHTFGLYSIFVQMVPFAVLHHQKPLAESLLSILGGLALGALCWRCRSFWIAVPLHAVQMILIDLFCTLRLRTGVNGYGLSAMAEIVRKLAAG